MSQGPGRPLHLHTLDSLLADLASGRPVVVADGTSFVLADPRARSALEWYRKAGASGWVANVTAALGEALVDTILKEPPELPSPAVRAASGDTRRLRLKKVEAHRFAGINKFGTLVAAPANYVHEFVAPITLFEGRNGSGKTSILNTIIWVLTGQLLRPQREPEEAQDFECSVDPQNPAGEQTQHKLSSVTPMPDVGLYRPDQPAIPADTWAELTFEDETGTVLPPIRRSQTRSARGKLEETPPDLSILGVDPIAMRIGTVMPGLLPLIKVGSESELGRAVGELTGLSSLNDLTDHVRRAKGKIDKDFVKAKTDERDKADSAYNQAKEDLEKITAANASIRPPKAVPTPSADVTIETTLDEISKHFENAKADAFVSAAVLLGAKFDPAKPAQLADLEKNIGGALERASRPQDLTSAARLAALRQVTLEQLGSAEGKIQSLLAEARKLEHLARDPSTAARVRLYARVAVWIEDHPDPGRDENVCLVCGGGLHDATDPVTGKPVKVHLHDAAADAALVSQTLSRWAKSALGDVMRSLPEALLAELGVDLPEHPRDLIRTALVDELFSFEPFAGVLAELKAATAASFEKVVAGSVELPAPLVITLPEECHDLEAKLKRLDKAIRFARWRQDNDALMREVVARVLGTVPKEGKQPEKSTLVGRLLELDAIAAAAKPISDALVQCDRLKHQLKARRAAEMRLAQYATASAALAQLLNLGRLADEQVDALRRTLSKEAAAWRSRIYLGAFPDTAHELVDTVMGKKGEVGIVVRTAGVSAPAQHVTNASALRASLVGFYLAFWEHVLKERGGITTLLLDDLQELLDDENRERLAAALAPLVKAGAQLILTSYDPRFSSRVSRLRINGGVEHLAVHPATRQQPVLRTTLSLPVIEERKARFDADRNAEEPARDFADACRVFLEAKLGDIFDDPAHSAWAVANPDPTLATFIQRLRPIVRNNSQGMFAANVFRRFVDHKALVDGSDVLTLMNKAHHGNRQAIRAADVAQCADDLAELLTIVEQMYEECYRWRRRDNPADASVVAAPPPLVPGAVPSLNVLVCPDLAAFTHNAPTGGTQAPAEVLDPQLLSGTATFFLRRSNFGFAAPAGSLAIVTALPTPVADRRLVVARHGTNVYARRLVRGTQGEIIGLTAEVPDPGTRNPKTILLPEKELAVHQVVGIIFEHSVKVAPGSDEAVLVDATEALRAIQISYRVIDTSAVPLALEKQVVLGGRTIDLAQLARHKGALVAVTLDDGSSIFKRVGEPLPGDLSHLWQLESIGGLGSSQVVSVGISHHGLPMVTSARLIIGVLYHG